MYIGTRDRGEMKIALNFMLCSSITFRPGAAIYASTVRGTGAYITLVYIYIPMRFSFAATRRKIVTTYLPTRFIGKYYKRNLKVRSRRGRRKQQ